MEIFYTTELAVPLLQVIMLLVWNTICLFLGKLRLALMINYVFVLFWGYVYNCDLFLSSGPNGASYVFIYASFGLVVCILAMVGFISQMKSRPPTNPSSL